MCGLFAALLRARRAPALRSGVMIQQRAGYIYSKPPKDNVSSAESALVLAVMTLAVLGPSGWVLAHIEDYKTRG